jgi:hypothetical protein
MAITVDHDCVVWFIFKGHPGSSSASNSRGVDPHHLRAASIDPVPFRRD